MLILCFYVLNSKSPYKSDSKDFTIVNLLMFTRTSYYESRNLMDAKINAFTVYIIYEFGNINEVTYILLFPVRWENFHIK